MGYEPGCPDPRNHGGIGKKGMEEFVSLINDPV
jgi:hypothetical protein